MGLDPSKLEKLIGQESDLLRALDPVTKSDIRHWCEVFGDPDPDYAQKIARVAKPAPPTMLLVWAMKALWPPRAEAREPHEQLFALLAEAGYSTVLGMGLDQEFQRPVGVGERLGYRVKVVGVSSGEEKSAFGSGYRVDLLYTFFDSKGAVVGTQGCQVFAYQTLRPAA